MCTQPARTSTPHPTPTLLAPQVSLSSEDMQAEWEYQYHLGRLACKLRDQGWQARSLGHYARACHLAAAYEVRGPPSPPAHPPARQPCPATLAS
jgi:hypothetical protein